MREQERYALALSAAEATYYLWELESEKGELDLDQMMRRLKDLSAYFLTAATLNSTGTRSDLDRSRRKQ
jgi:hypothetical protein